MRLEIHTINNVSIAEIISEEVLIKTTEDGLDLLGNLYYQGFNKIILHSRNITDDFFDLKTGLAGEILQKFSNYRVELAIIGDLSKYTSKSLEDFIFESNKTGSINFVATFSEALNCLTKIR